MPPTPLIMGILNATPDSFSDGGRFVGREAALTHARRMIAQGADIIDIGGESTRPDAPAISQDEELARTIPLIEAIRDESDVRLSIDTMKPAVARAAVAAGATIWNDVTALAHDPGSAATAAQLGCTVVLMHMRGNPRTMTGLTDYQGVVGDIWTELKIRLDGALAEGVAPTNIWLDPGIGFSKTADQSLTVIRHLRSFVGHGFPVVVGASRKSFIRAIDSTATDPGDRLAGALAVALRAADAGAGVLRVHDVRETAQALAMWRATRP